MRLSEDPPMCPICGGLHPSGHRDDELLARLESAREYFEIHCAGCDVMDDEDDDCEGCSYDHIKGLLGFQSSRGTANE